MSEVVYIFIPKSWDKITCLLNNGSLKRSETSKKSPFLTLGIGPTYSSKMMRCGVRVADLLDDFENFKMLFNSLADQMSKSYPDLKIDRDAEMERYKVLAERIRPLVIESVAYLNKKVSKGAKILVEGANAGMIDIDFGIYPYVTSSNCSIGGVCTGLGIPPQVKLEWVYNLTTLVLIGHIVSDCVVDLFFMNF